MDAFEKAKAKYEKNRERQERPMPKVEVPEKKAEPKREGPMVVSISGPQQIVFEIEYTGTLMSGQLTKPELTELFKRQLSALGRVRCL